MEFCEGGRGGEKSGKELEDKANHFVQKEKQNKERERRKEKQTDEQEKRSKMTCKRRKVKGEKKG